MDLTLTPVEVRVLGCLIEKAVTTPEYYPLTLNSLTIACNQRTNRNPVVDYDEDQVNAALDSLREQGLVRRVDTAGGRAPKFRHILNEVTPLDDAQLAILCVLLLRGAQTVGELRARTERMFTFRDLAHVEAVLKSLVEPAEESGLDTPLAVALPRRPGSRETRYIHLLAPVSIQPEEEDFSAEASGPIPALEPKATRSELEALRQEVESLRTELQTLRADFDALKAELM